MDARVSRGNCPMRWIAGYGERSEKYLLIFCALQIGFGSNRKTRHLMPSGHKAFLVHNTRDVDLLLMHNKTYAAEYVPSQIAKI